MLVDDATPRVGVINVSPDVLASVPDVGSVTLVVPVTVNVVPKAPEIVSVLAVLFTIPVPPLAGRIAPLMSPDTTVPGAPARATIFQSVSEAL
jgi:hypothetical protein